MKTKYAKRKKDLTGNIALILQNANIEPVERCFLEFQWQEPHRRRDPDNIAGGGRKYCLDALIQAGILENDGWKQIAGWRDNFVVKEDEGIHLRITEC